MSKQCPHCNANNPDEVDKCQWCGKGFDEPLSLEKQILPVEQKELTDRDNVKQCPHCKRYYSAEKEICQWCGGAFKEEVACVDEQVSQVSIYPEKKLLKIFTFSLKKALTLKIWLGLAFWGIIFFIPIVTTIFSSTRLLFPIFTKLEAKGIGLEQLLAPLENIFAVQSGNISIYVYLVYFILFCVTAIILGLSSGVYGYIHQILTKDIIHPIKTFWYYLTHFYFPLTFLFFILMFLGIFLPLRIVQILGNHWVVIVVWLLWNILLGIYTIYVPIMLICENSSIFGSLNKTAVFIKNNFWKIIALSIMLGISTIILQMVFALFLSRTILSFIILFVMVVYQLLVITFAEFTFYIANSKLTTEKSTNEQINK